MEVEERTKEAEEEMARRSSMNEERRQARAKMKDSEHALVDEQHEIFVETRALRAEWEKRELTMQQKLLQREKTALVKLEDDLKARRKKAHLAKRKEMDELVAAAESKGMCTFAITGKTPTLQKWYRCLDCHPLEKGASGCCFMCRKLYHAGHNVEFADISDFYCGHGEDNPEVGSSSFASSSLLVRALLLRLAALL